MRRPLLHAIPDLHTGFLHSVCDFRRSAFGFVLGMRYDFLRAIGNFLDFLLNDMSSLAAAFFGIVQILFGFPAER
ncbi:MAG: hypothetical protein L6V35_09945 [Alistipes putredinis]|nr:MAG: hypothetical protein L6V35_09945 [Alistipes putredinis]